MREILYRGKRTDTGEWVEGFFAKSGDKTFIIFDNDIAVGYVTMKEVIPETVGQYTGLTGTNGKKIFEGDIIKFGRNIYEVLFEVGSFALYDRGGKMITKIGGVNDHCYSLMQLYIECCWEDCTAYDIEILGNIHDNPEFLV